MQDCGGLQALAVSSVTWILDTTTSNNKEQRFCLYKPRDQEGQAMSLIKGFSACCGTTVDSGSRILLACSLRRAVLFTRSFENTSCRPVYGIGDFQTNCRRKHARRTLTTCRVIQQSRWPTCPELTSVDLVFLAWSCAARLFRRAVGGQERSV